MSITSSAPSDNDDVPDLPQFGKGRIRTSQLFRDYSSDFKRQWDLQLTQTVSMPESVLISNPILNKMTQDSFDLSDLKEELDELDDIKAIKKSDLIKGAPLGRGGFGVVYAAQWKGKKVAVKELQAEKQLDSNELKNFANEVKVLSRFGGHPNVITVLGYTLDPLGIVMELADPKLGSLHNVLYKLNDDEARAKFADGRVKKRIVLGIVIGLMQLHAAR